MTTSNLQDRARELIAQSITNVTEGLGCSTEVALELLMTQCASRLPEAVVREALFFMYDYDRLGRAVDYPTYRAILTGDWVDGKLSVA